MKTILWTLPAGLALALLASPALAAECDPFANLSQEGRLPEMFIIKAEAGNVHFEGDDGKEMTAHLVPGNLVIVTAQDGDKLCATYTGEAPKFTTTVGWLPKSALEAITPKPDRASWIGDWRLGDEQEIKIAGAGRDRLAITGYASFGGDDPKRVANGGVNTGSIEAKLPMQAEGWLTLSLDDNDQPIAGASLADTDQCVVRMWQLPPYLVVADNQLCGGQNVTFTGVYTKGVAE
jgi:hypothetical protein